MTEKIQPAPLPTLWETWTIEQMAELTPATLNRYRSVFYRFRTWFEAIEQRPLDLADLHPVTLVGYRNWLQETAAAATVNTHVYALRTWCAWLVANAYLAANPAARLKPLQQQPKPAPSALQPRQVHALLQAAQQTRYPERNTALLQMMLQTGMRIGECAALRWGDLAFGERSGSVLIRAGKGNQTRRVPLNQSIRQALATYVAPLLQVENTLKAVAAVWAAQPPSRPLWQSERGGALSVCEISRMIQHLVQTCAVRNTVPSATPPHALRHTFATRYLLRHPGDLVGLAWLLGHRSIRTTQIYVQPTEEEMAKRVSQIDLNAYAD